MTGSVSFDGARSVSVDFDGVLPSLVLGRTWEKTRAPKKSASFLSPSVRAVKTGIAALTEGLRKPLPNAEAAIREIRSQQRQIYLLTSRTLFLRIAYGGPCGSLVLRFGPSPTSHG